MKVTRLTQTPAEWLTSSDASHHGIVVCSRLRLARNVAGFAFPTWAKKPEREKVFEKVFPVVTALAPMADPAVADSMDHFTVFEKQILMEQHLISREHAAKHGGSGIVASGPRTLSIMINEEDHLRMQSFTPGLDLDLAWRQIDAVDSELDRALEFAFTPRLGYLTACPSNVGTGMRASAMLHLPALVLSDQVNQIINAVGKLGLAVRGLYGEGTEALGNLFQVSNQMTLGETEAGTLEKLNKVILNIVDHEQNARATLLEKRPRMVADQIGRAYGVLTNAHAVASKEALNLLSILRLGVDLKLLPRTLRPLIDELMISTQPAHLQLGCEQKLSPDDRDGVRADLIRAKLAVLKRPDSLRNLVARETKEKDKPNPDS
jgi:protein arginine kinase